MSDIGCLKCGWFEGALDAAQPPDGWCVEHLPGAVKAPETPEERDAAQFVADTRDLLGRIDFRRFILRVIDHGNWCHAHAQDIDFENVNRTHYHAGRQSVGIQLREWLKEVDARLYMKLLEEMAELPPQPHVVRSPQPRTP